MFVDILQSSHSLCLAHLPQALHDSAVEQPLFSSIASTYRDVERSSRPYLGQREQVGLFLKVRATCRFSLYYCSSWYQETVRREVKKIVSVQDMQSCVVKARLDLSGSCWTRMTFEPGISLSYKAQPQVLQSSDIYKFQ